MFGHPRQLLILAFAMALLLASLPLASAKETNATSPVTLANGSVGAVAIGMSIEMLQRLLRRKLELQFAGDNRAGISIEGKAELSALGIARMAGVSVSGADILFAGVADRMRVDMVSLGIPCESVDLLSQRLRTSAEAVHRNERAGWSNVDAKYKYVWGAEVKPVCRFWLRYG